MIDFFGTTGSDSLDINNSDTAVFAGSGDDTINGSTHSGSSQNRFYGGGGADTIFVENGDTAFGEAGDDVIYSVSGEKNILFGGAGNDQIYAGAEDLAFGGAGNDEFTFVDIPAAPATIADFSREEGNTDKIVISLPGVTINDIDQTETGLSKGEVKLTDGSVLAIVKNAELTTDDLVFPDSPILTADGAPSGFTGAVPLTAGTKAGSFSSLDSGDMYKITLAERSAINIELSGLFPGSNGDLTLFSEANVESAIAASQLDYNSDESISFDFLAAGTYYLSVQQDTGYSNYTLDLSINEKPLVDDGAGSTIAGAPTLSEGQNQGSISYLDTSDLYHIELTGNGIIDLAVTLADGEPTADFDLILFDNNYQPVAASQNDAGMAESINNLPLAAGDYYVLIDALNAGLTNLEKLTIAGVNYELTYSLTPLVQDGAPNGFSNAVDLTEGTKQGSFFVDVDTADAYKFNVPAGGGTVTVSLNYDLDGTGAELFLYADTSDLNNPLALDQNPENGTTIEQVLAAGEYYLLIANVVGVTNYTLELSIA